MRMFWIQATLSINDHPCDKNVCVTGGRADALPARREDTSVIYFVSAAVLFICGAGNPSMKGAS